MSVLLIEGLCGSHSLRINNIPSCLISYTNKHYFLTDHILEGLNFGTVFRGIFILSFVLGLYPFRALRVVFLNVPNPISLTGRPFFTSILTVSIRVFIIPSASLFVILCFFAIFSINVFLFTVTFFVVSIMLS